MLDTINFSQEYRKLTYPRFPTIRGKSWINRISMKDHVKRITIKREFKWHAELIYIKKLPINQIPPQFLKWDVYPEKLGSYWDFIFLLNKFRRYNKLVNPDCEVCVLILDKIEVL